MIRILSAIGLMKSFQMTLDLSKEEFQQLFKSHVAGFPQVAALSRPKTEFQGGIKKEEYTIARSIDIFDSSSIAAATFTTHEQDQCLVLSGETTIPATTLLLFSSLLILINGASILSILSNEKLVALSYFIPVFISTSMALSYYFFSFMRKSVERLNKDLQRELYYWTKSHE